LLFGDIASTIYFVYSNPVNADGGVTPPVETAPVYNFCSRFLLPAAAQLPEQGVTSEGDNTYLFFREPLVWLLCVLCCDSLKLARANFSMQKSVIGKIVSMG